MSMCERKWEYVRLCVCVAWSCVSCLKVKSVSHDPNDRTRILFVLYLLHVASTLTFGSLCRSISFYIPDVWVWDVSNKMFLMFIECGG